MQSYAFSLKPTLQGQAIQLSARGNLFVYESGNGPTLSSETRVYVKPDSGAEILLRPGQRFRPANSAQTWYIRLYGTENVDGFFIIGEGDFDDANTVNVMKLDASFANNVAVTNDAAHAIPIMAPVALPVTIQNSQVEITNDAGNRIPVSLDPTQVPGAAAPIMAYTNYKSFTALAANGVGTIFTPAENTNGVIIEQIISGRDFSVLLAKAGAVPANKTDGDVLSMALNVAAAYTTRQKIAAGKGGYIVCSSAGAGDFYVLYTVL
jgi:hypothetical protein